MKKSRAIYYFTLFILTFTSLITPAYSEVDLQVVPYSDLITKLTIKDLESFIKKFHPETKNDIELTCLETTNQKHYVGLWHQLIISAPLKNVAQKIEDFENYPKVFGEVKNSKILSSLNHLQWTIQFENKAPAFFLPNIHYQMDYSMAEIAGSKLYKYHLSDKFKQKNIQFSDGLILIKEEHGETKFYELDFFQSNWGLNIWSESINDMLISDLELKYSVENLILSDSDKKTKIQKTLLEINHDKVFEKCLNNKLNFQNIYSKLN